MSPTPPRLALRIGTALALASSLLLPIMGQAGARADEAAFSNTLPEFISGPIDFDVVVAATAPAVCQMTYGTQERSTAPWTFRYDPSNRVSMIRVTTCQSGSFNYYLSPLPELAYFVSRTSGIREAGHKVKMFVINNAELPGNALIADPSGKVLLRSAIDTRRSTALTVTLPKITNRLAYLSVTITSDNGSFAVKDQIPISRGWANITVPLPIAACSKITWRYLPNGAPKGTSRTKVEADIVRALDTIGAASGLSFTKTADAGEVLAARTSITFGWRAVLGNSGAEPQSVATKDPLGYRVRSQVWLNALASGMTDRYAGASAGRAGATPGRVWPISRAVLRILGLEETREKGNLMFPSLVGPSGLGAGDRFALDHLYRPSGCISTN